MRNYDGLFRFMRFVYVNNKAKIRISFFLVILVTMLDLYLPQLVKDIIDKGISGSNLKVLITLVLAYISINILSSLVDFFLGYSYSIMRNNVAVKIRINLLRHLYDLSGKHYTDKKTGEILSTIQSDVSTVESIDAELVFSIIKSAVTALLSIYFMYNLQVELLLLVVVFQLILVLIQRSFTRNIHNNISMVRKSYGDIFNIVQEYVLNIVNIVFSKSRKFFISEYIKKERELIKKSITTDMLYSGNISVAMVINSISTAVLYGYGGYKIINGELSLGELIAFQSYSAMLVGPCMTIVNANNRIQQSLVSLNKIYSLVDLESDTKDSPEYSILEHGQLKKIEFKNVCFRYDKDRSEEKILKKISMEFEKGKVTAIVGMSGCGKSTIVNLIYRLWDVQSGSILLDGIDIRNFNLKSVRKNISVVTQNSLIFDSSIRENICLGKKVDDYELNILCKCVGLDSFVKTLDEGIDTNIGEMGVKISGGQKQRISIARALLSDSDVFIMDESTSALDNISQREIIDNLKIHFRDKIVIVIAHRLSTIKDVDKIYVMHEGGVIEEGNHIELLSRNSYYSKIYREE